MTENKILTIGDMVGEFRRTFGMEETSASAINGKIFAHDAVRVMTGFGIGAINELRVNIVSTAMNYGTTATALQLASIFAKDMKRVLSGEFQANAQAGRFENQDVRLAQTDFNALPLREVNALFTLGRDMLRALQKQFNNNLPYPAQWPEAIAMLPFQHFDFSTRGQEIIRKYASPHNNQVEQKTMNALQQSATTLGAEAEQLPPYGVSWTQHILRNIP